MPFAFMFCLLAGVCVSVCVSVCSYVYPGEFLFLNPVYNHFQPATTGLSSFALHGHGSLSV